MNPVDTYLPQPQTEFVTDFCPEERRYSAQASGHRPVTIDSNFRAFVPRPTSRTLGPGALQSSPSSKVLASKTPYVYDRIWRPVSLCPSAPFPCVFRNFRYSVPLYHVCTSPLCAYIQLHRNSTVPRMYSLPRISGSVHCRTRCSQPQRTRRLPVTATVSQSLPAAVHCRER
jgi:hypothetical protein